jgi:hypothetical protein
MGDGFANNGNIEVTTGNIMKGKYLSLLTTEHGHYN